MAGSQPLPYTHGRCVASTASGQPVGRATCAQLLQTHPHNTYPSLCTLSSPHQVWEGKGVVATARKMIGATNPLASEPGTIRGDFAIEVRSGAMIWAPG